MLEWLAHAFGFEEKLRFADEDGTVTHAERTIGDESSLMGDPGGEYRSPKTAVAGRRRFTSTGPG